VPRTFEMTHVDPTHFAVALGKDPARIFEFVRDQIAYEVYTGCLRGPRGTLMAMAGNSVDRAALLASMLQHAGHRVRYVRGSLPEREAKELVTSMWADRPQVAEPKVGGEPAPALKAALDTLAAGVKRDYTLIRDHLKRANLTIPRESAPSLDSLVKEAQAHYWVQWWKDGTWVDVDPSFADATPGRKYAPVAETSDALPAALFHRVSIRVRVEEYAILLTGNAQGTPTSRDILSYTAKAADLSGVDLFLSHQPENWKGPATSLQEAISSAIESTGRVKPVLVVGPEQLVTGEPFRQKPPTGAGIGSITDLLGGAGTRKPVPVATAETIEFDFISPGGRKETVVRQIFDVVGKARRAARQNLTADEVRERTEAQSSFDVTQAVYDLFFTTGRVDAVHLLNVAEDSPPTEGEGPDIRAALLRINITLAAGSDGLMARGGQPDRAVILFYPDSPRVQIAEASVAAGTGRLSLDLRRSEVRAVTPGPSEDVFDERIVRGVVEGALERSLMEYLMELAPERDREVVMSTSLVFERARAEGVPTLLLKPGGPDLSTNTTEESRAMVREELGRGFWVVVPERQIVLGSGKRLAWWRIDPRVGKTTAVTDEGLYGAMGYSLQKKTIKGKVRVVAKLYEIAADGTRTLAHPPWYFAIRPPGWRGVNELAEFVATMLRIGIPRVPPR